ncbi:cilia- and flagella-associated protein 99-like isoform X2 [Biomphalaria glabrata]|nr:cilia- and flagella-associated protein 99-like isoform X2 [Biomphalaria glabrata]XP_055896174.1 cilia- and flagella-associated protein 99-like isoform X2 [Biomphalaria glabrata]XP_055896180.1 cilia- and flagella-associated protein 99-like isoform X2 [Biomphalaria glabrata]XP_055896190.1 cilia- and flagella-associated protein 99-like isoform X2 [Biomphalaria glabrata]XP_055896195.1 cilia- and flagella-associated protein 99-like isoform X2 [Biomphalaria glabrata]
MDAKHQQLFVHCAQLLDTFQEKSTDLEDHLKEYIRSSRIQDVDDETFITEVFSGCVQHRPVMKLVVDGFYVRDGKNILLSHQNSFIVLAYLALYRLDELGVAHFRKFVDAMELNATYKFLSFLFDEKNLLTWMKDGWSTLYEWSYVETNLLSPLLRWLPELKDLVLLMKKRINNQFKPKKIAVKATDAKPFNLTQPRARSIPLPEKIPQLQRVKPIPATVYNQPTEQRILEKQKEENRRQAEERLMEASRIQFACANPEKSEKTKQIIQNIVFEENSKVEPTVIKAKPLPDFKKSPAPVKMTAATILREGLLYQKKEKEVMERLQKLEAGAFDASNFHKWQSEMKQKDLEAQLLAIEERRLMGKISHEEAFLARTNVLAANQQLVQNMKKETAAMMKEYLENKFRQEKEMRELVESTMAGHKNAQNAKQKLQELKHKIVQEVQEESRELMKQALEEAELEMRCKIELIQQIRAIESTPVNRFKPLDLTATSGAGLLGEMSIAELRERLSLMKAQRKEDEEIKRDNILYDKQAKAESLCETLDKIAKHRSEQTKMAALKADNSKNVKLISVPLKSATLTELERKLDEKREQRKLEKQRYHRSAESVSDKTNLTSLSAKKSLSNRRWQELENSKERAARFFAQTAIESLS